MPPEGYVPGFWETLMTEMRVKQAENAGLFDADRTKSPYWSDDVLVGEIVEDEQKEISA